MTLNSTWTPYAVFALSAGWILGTFLFNRGLSPRRVRWMLVVAGVLILVLAFFNVFGSFVVAANGAAVLLFVAALRLHRLQKRNDGSGHLDPGSSPIA